MKGPAVSLLLGVCVLLLPGPTGSEVSIDVRPNLQQFFSGENVSLSCDDDQQTVKRTRGQTGGQTGGLRLNRTRGGQTGGQVEQCGGSGGFGVFNGSSCSIPSLSQSDSGVYWCETSSGERSLQVDITVSLKDGPLILEIPALPVVTGSDVTLRCRSRGGGARAAYFLRNGVHAGNRTAVPELSIRRVQLSDEGFYSCSTDVFGPSAQSWLRVTDPPPTAPPAPPLPVSLPRLSCLLLVACLYCVCTVVMVTLCRRRRRRRRGRRGGRRPTAVVVSVETAQSDHEYDDLTADVITEL